MKLKRTEKIKGNDFLTSPCIGVFDDRGKRLDNIVSVCFKAAANDIPTLVIERIVDKKEKFKLPPNCTRRVNAEDEFPREELVFLVQDVTISFKKEQALLQE